MDVKELIRSQREYFHAGHTRPLATRRATLLKFYKLLRENEDMLAEAIYRDFKKSHYATVENELSIPYGEINHTLRKLRRWSRSRYQRTNLANSFAANRSVPVPYGVSLVIGPWNYPYMLSLVPVVSALAAGNTVVLKPSEITAHSSAAMAKLINENFPRELLHVVEGGVPETTELLSQKFDKIFFTGSTAVGKIVMKAAAEHLTPVTLELGGKNPVIVMPDCDLKLAARRIIWGKFHNNGMACVAPDHIYVHESIHDEFLAEVKKQIPKILGEDPRESSSLPRMVDDRNYHRVMGLINPEKVVLGGGGDPGERYIEPTLMDGVDAGDAVMKEEVFGPLMSLLKYSDADELMEDLKKQDAPLMFYVFTSNIRKAKRMMKELPSGGGMINDVILLFINLDSPFGGVGASGMGAYHGKAGFDAFTHQKTVMRKFNFFELFLKYPPYRKAAEPLLRAVVGKSVRNLFR